MAIGGAIPAGGDRAVIEAKSAAVKVIVQLIPQFAGGTVRRVDHAPEQPCQGHTNSKIAKRLTRLAEMKRNTKLQVLKGGILTGVTSPLQCARVQ